MKLVLRMHRLFWKIFLWFWIATILVFVATAWSTAQLYRGSGDFRFGQRMQGELDQMATAAAAILETQGPAELQQWLQPRRRKRHHHGPPLFLLDEDGTDLFGRPMPEHIAELMANPEPGHAHILESNFTTSDGSHYRLVSLRRGHPRHRAYMPLFFARRPEFAGLRLLIALAVSGLVCFGLARYLVTPIRRLQDATERIADGDLSYRVAEQLGNRRDEIADLGHAFDRMAEQLQALLDSQRQLLSDVSHELRSPLARVQVALGLARKRGGNDIVPELDRIERDCEELNVLIGDLLSLARIDAGAVSGELQPVNAAGILRDVVENANFESGETKQANLTSPADARVVARPELLKSAFDNVVRNALYYSSVGGEVDVALTVDSDTNTLQITVRDHGPGVPPDQLKRIFEPFVRTSSARDRDSGGAGLGLAIAKRALATHHGNIEARNAEHGDGLVVVITLPTVSG